jgi:hypothetical protein
MDINDIKLSFACVYNAVLLELCCFARTLGSNSDSWIQGLDASTPACTLDISVWACLTKAVDFQTNEASCIASEASKLFIGPFVAF